MLYGQDIHICGPMHAVKWDSSNDNVLMKGVCYRDGSNTPSTLYSCSVVKWQQSQQWGANFCNSYIASNSLASYQVRSISMSHNFLTHWLIHSVTHWLTLPSGCHIIGIPYLCKYLQANQTSKHLFYFHINTMEKLKKRRSSRKTINLRVAAAAAVLEKTIRHLGEK